MSRGFQSSPIAGRRKASGRKRRPGPRGYSTWARRFWDYDPPEWPELVKQYPKHPALDSGTVYALPPDLVAAIQSEMPAFFTKEEQDFERDLAAAGGDGFFMRRAFRYPPLPSRDTQREIREIKARLVHEPRIVLKEDERGVPVSAMGRGDDDWAWQRLQKPDVGAVNRDRENQSWVTKRQWGYAGWLVTEPRFQYERDQFVGGWQDVLEVLAEFPKASWFTGSWHARVRGTRFRQDWKHLSDRWCLDTLMTSELPVPILPQATRGAGSPFSRSPECVGMNVLMPWYLFRQGERDLDPMEILEDESFFKGFGLDQLNDWFGAKPKNWGLERYILMLQTYVYLELCLRRRYPQRLSGNLGRFDIAFAEFTAHHECRRVDVENIRKVRQEMQRRLRRDPLPPRRAYRPTPSANDPPHGPWPPGARPGDLPTATGPASPATDLELE